MNRGKKFLSSLCLMWVIILMYYIYTKFKNNFVLQNINLYGNLERNYLIDTPGCQILNYSETMHFYESHNRNANCGVRAIEVNKRSENNIVFLIDDSKMKSYTTLEYQCCYQFVTRTYKKGAESIIYGTCSPFNNDTSVKLEQEIVLVKCIDNINKTIYKDVYMLVKKITLPETKLNADKPSWNVLILGMDSMSRGRLLNSMKNTTKYLNNNDWLDFKGYNKIGWNTFPNIVAFMTGKNMSNVYVACEGGMSNCNDIFLWDKFQQAGYATTYAEDNLSLPDTFKNLGFKDPPTNHYMRPLFLTGETTAGNLLCTKKLKSGEHITNYIIDFSNTYRKEKFFGLFWINSFSHNLNQLPTLADDLMQNTLKTLQSNDVLNNTFIIFNSDHGQRFGKTRLAFEGYYEELLPMFFMWVPYKFRKRHKKAYEALKLNQDRLVTPYDLYLTLLNVLTTSSSHINSNEADSSEGCHKCQSLFSEVSLHRNCEQVDINPKWCSCFKFEKADITDPIVKGGLTEAIYHVNNTAVAVKTKKCSKCADLHWKKTLRSHVFQDKNTSYYLYAFKMLPIDNHYEVLLGYNGSYSVHGPTYNLDIYGKKSLCTIFPHDRGFCECRKQQNCKPL